MTKTCTCGATFETDQEDRILCDACKAQVPAGDATVTETPVETPAGTPVTETPAAGDGEPTA